MLHVYIENLNVVSFEPSTSNTRILSRNISINKLSDKIKIFQLPLCDKADVISFFNETQFTEGWSHQHLIIKLIMKVKY